MSKAVPKVPKSLRDPSGTWISQRKMRAEDTAVSSKLKVAEDAYTHAEKFVSDLEDRLGIEERWEPLSNEYQEALKYKAQRRYVQALDALKVLVVHRIFELQKLHISGTGMLLI